jgi:hypothetical protein
MQPLVDISNRKLPWEEVLTLVLGSLYAHSRQGGQLGAIVPPHICKAAASNAPPFRSALAIGRGNAVRWVREPMRLRGSRHSHARATAAAVDHKDILRVLAIAQAQPDTA